MHFMKMKEFQELFLLCKRSPVTTSCFICIIATITKKLLKRIISLIYNCSILTWLTYIIGRPFLNSHYRKSLGTQELISGNSRRPLKLQTSIYTLLTHEKFGWSCLWPCSWAHGYSRQKRGRSQKHVVWKNLQLVWSTHFVIGACITDISIRDWRTAVKTTLFLIFA